MRTKLSDAEFVERARASARRRSERQRLRKLESGKIQVNHWLTAPAKERLDALATELNASPSEVVTAAILAYLATPRPVDSVDAMPADTGGFNQDLAAFKLAVVKFWNAGITGYGAIATALEAGGYRNSNGNLYTRETVKRTLIRAGLVAETGKATKENGE